MNNPFSASTKSLVIAFAVCLISGVTSSIAVAQHLGHHGGHSIGHIGHSGYGIGHGISHGIGYGYGHGIGHIGVGHIGHGYGGYYSGHYGSSHYGYGHSGYGHSYYPHVDVYASPYYSGYSGYGYSPAPMAYYNQCASPAVNVIPCAQSSPPNTIPCATIPYATVPYASVPYAVATPTETFPEPPLAPSLAANLDIPPSPPRLPVESDDDGSYRSQAVTAFRQSNFQAALRATSHALVDAPRDGELLLFLAQCLLALGDYEGSAAAVHQAAASLEPKQWGYIVENFRLYYRGTAYDEQMERLSQFIESNPDAGYARFLRGYQFGFLGQAEFAVRDLNKAYELESRDELASKLIERFADSRTIPNSSNANAPIQLDFPPPATVESDSHAGHNHS